MLDSVVKGVIVTLLSAMVYFVFSVWGVYHLQHRLKPDHVTDLPVFS